MSSDESAPTASRRRRAKKFLTPSMKYEIWLQLVRGEVTIAQAATAAAVDRSTIIRVRQVAKEGATAAASKPGVGSSLVKRWRRWNFRSSFGSITRV